MDDKKKPDDSEEQFRERLTWNDGDLDIMEVPGKTPEELKKIQEEMGNKSDVEAKSMIVCWRHA